MIKFIISNLWEIIAGWLATYGLFGVFGISFLGSLVIFVPAPYFIPVAIVSQIIDPTTVALVSACGATLAKTIVFRASYYVQNLLDEKTRQNLRPFERLVSRFGWIAVFVAASTPIPDDLIFIPLGFAKYPLWKFVPITLVGKFLLALIIAWGANLSLPFIAFLVEGSTDPIGSVAIIVGLTGLVALGIYATTRIDWQPLILRWFPSVMTDDHEDKDSESRKP